MKFAWLDVRNVADDQRDAVVEAALHCRLAGVLDDRPERLAALPPTVLRVLLPAEEPRDGDGDGGVDLVLKKVTEEAAIDRLSAGTGAFVDVVDQASLDLACRSAIGADHTLVRFRDPTKIPLEIVIAAADAATGSLVCEVSSIEEARIVVDVLEKGSDGLLLAPTHPDEVFRLAEMLGEQTPELALTTLVVDSIEHNGLGDRVCVDTCTHFGTDEGMLIGSFAHGFMLCVSETHPLPYMPTRPFRVNAGALHSYTLGPGNRTNYLSELGTGSTALAVSADGRTRRITVGRAKIESRPLLTIRATADCGTSVALTVQDDWHVRVLGPGATVLNVTELGPGSKILGFVATDRRHVGWAIDEFCIEK